jgi:DNA-binding MarR family transcriptional regulator
LQPSELSAALGVSRNTVSALLNGLEEQGLIERHLHPTDRRQFLVRITPAGCDLVRTRAPQFAAFIASLLDDLSPDERHTLFVLLDKLYSRMLERAVEAGINVPGIDPETFNEPT